MHDPLHRLYRTKIALLAVLLMFVGLGLLIFGRWTQHVAGWDWLSNWPIIDIGSAMFTTGLLGVAWQYVDGSDGEARDTERLKRVLAESAPAMRDAVISGFAFNLEDLAHVATTETLDRIVANGLAMRLGDSEFANEIYEDLRNQAIGIPERLHDARIAIRLSSLPVGSDAPKGRAMSFAVTVRWEFKVIPTYATRRFVCLSDIDEFRELDQDTVATSAWYFKPKAGLEAGDKEAFELVEFTVDGQTRNIRRTARSGSQTYAVSVGKDAVDAGQPVTLCYTYRTVTAVDGHLLRLRVDQPTRGLSIDLDYGDTDITDVSVVDFIASSDRTRISRSPTSVPGKSVSIEFEGWVFPRSGVAFVWSYAHASTSANPTQRGA